MAWRNKRIVVVTWETTIVLSGSSLLLWSSTGVVPARNRTNSSPGRCFRCRSLHPMPSSFCTFQAAVVTSSAQHRLAAKGFVLWVGRVYCLRVLFELLFRARSGCKIPIKTNEHHPVNSPPLSICDLSTYLRTAVYTHTCVDAKFVYLCMYVCRSECLYACMDGCTQRRTDGWMNG